MFNRTRKTAAGFAASASAIGLLGVWTLGWAAEPSANGAATTDMAPVFGPRWDSGKRLDRLSRHLDLTAEQKTRIGEILSASRNEGEQLRAKLQSLRSELHAAVTADEFYEDQVRILIETKSPVMVELMLLGAKTMNAVRAELTPEQREQAEAMMASRSERRRGRPHGFFGQRHN